MAVEGPELPDHNGSLLELLSSNAAGVAVVAAHPDDEIIGAGIRLHAWREPHVIFVTDGSPPDPADARNAGFSDRGTYAQARFKESIAALALAGVERKQVHPLDFPDQGASVALAEIANALAKQFAVRPTSAVVTHPYEGGHPDHDATAFTVHLACRILRERNRRAPAIFEMTSYHNRDGWMETGRFLPGQGEGTVLDEPWDAETRSFKAHLFSCFETQENVLRCFPIEPERFRVAPRYDFTQPPHAGLLFYESFNWGMNGKLWRELARKALALHEHRGDAAQTQPKIPLEAV